MNTNKAFKFFLPPLIVLFFIFGVIVFPNESIESAREGLNIWVTILIPSLLPFIIGANLIIDLKIVDIIGVIINPITKFVFNVSGKSALVFAISTVSGYPVGAKLASELREKNEISKFEAQRLISFCSTSGPLFIIGAVSTGMFKNPSLGYLMLFCHYLGSISVGLLFRKYGKETLKKNSNSLKLDISRIVNNKINDNKGFFVSFGNSTFNGINTILMVGGYVIIFSVIFKILYLLDIVSIVSSIIYIPFSILGFTKELCDAFIGGLFEMTIGCNKVSSIVNISEVLRASLCSFLIAFSGLSILAQCSNFLAKTDININLYIISKFLHGIFASVFTFVLYPISKSTVVVSSFDTVYNVLYNNFIWNSYIQNFYSFIPLFIIIYIFFILCFIERLIFKSRP